MSSDDLSYRLDLSRGTVIHHINKLMEAGIVISSRNKYMLRVDNLKLLIDEVEKDLHRSLNDLRDVASDLDEWLGL